MEAEIKSLRTPGTEDNSEVGDAATEPYRPLTAELTSLREENASLLARLNDDREAAQKELVALKQNLRRSADENEALRKQLQQQQQSMAAAGKM